MSSVAFDTIMMKKTSFPRHYKEVQELFKELKYNSIVSVVRQLSQPLVVLEKLFKFHVFKAIGNIFKRSAT